MPEYNGWALGVRLTSMDGCHFFDGIGRLPGPISRARDDLCIYEWFIEVCALTSKTNDPQTAKPRVMREANWLGRR